jgi:hypothetical protein
VWVAWEVEFTDEFGDWWGGLSEDEQVAIAARIALLEQNGPNLRRPAVGEIKGSKHDPKMKELRIAVGGDQLRILFVFDPRRVAVLLVGGSKTGRWTAWYATAVPEADALYDTLLDELNEEGLT